MNHPVTLDDHARIVENLLRIQRAEVPLALAEHHWHHIHRHLVHEAERKCLAPDVSGADRNDTVTGAPLGLLHRGCDVLKERHVSVGMPHF